MLMARSRRYRMHIPDGQFSGKYYSIVRYRLSRLAERYGALGCAISGSGFRVRAHHGAEGGDLLVYRAPSARASAIPAVESRDLSARDAGTRGCELAALAASNRVGAKTGSRRRNQFTDPRSCRSTGESRRINRDEKSLRRAGRIAEIAKRAPPGPVPDRRPYLTRDLTADGGADPSPARAGRARLAV